MIRRCCAILVGAAVLATLGGCHPGQKAGHGEVSGQILPGSVSDAMLPYDSVKSKAPLAPRDSGTDADNGAGDEAADTADAAAAVAASAVPVAPASPGPAAPAVAN
jgi:hypothetical protein